MSCKHLNKNSGKCNIKDKKVDDFNCNRCMLKIENPNNNKFDFKGTPFEDIFKNIF